jgi:hypothetical protein
LAASGALLTLPSLALPVFALAVSRGLQIWAANAMKAIAAQASTIHKIVTTAVFVFGVSRFAFSLFTVRNISLGLS